MEISYTPVPCICKGMIEEQEGEDYDANMLPVYIYDSPIGEIERILTKLSYMPSLDQNFKVGDHVMCLVILQWSSEGKYIGVVQQGSHATLGIYTPIEMAKFDEKSPNADLDGVSQSVLDKTNQAGMIIEKSGAVRIVTSGKVKTVYSPDGDGVYEELNTTYAQNHMRILTGDPPFFRSREHFGIYNGADLDDKIVKATDPSNISMVYRRYVQQSRSLDNWVSTNEGTWSPWVGENNDSTTIKRTKDILYNKIINNGQNRITIHAGEPDEGFFTFRMDVIDMAPLRGETATESGGVTPVSATKSFYLGISPEGELKAEMAMQADAPGADAQPAASLTVTKDGNVNFDVGKSFTINGKKLLTESFLDFFTKHQLDLFQTVALGAPSPMSPAATPDFTTGSGEGEFLTDAVENELESDAPDLKST